MKILIQFEKKPLLFDHPESIISCNNSSSFKSCFEKIEAALSAGYYAAGFLSYEAGYCFEDRLRDDKDYDFPLLHIGIYGAPSTENTARGSGKERVNIKNARLNISRDKYFDNIQKIRSHIEKGDVYQITYCIKLLFESADDPLSLYNSLLKEQPVPYPALVQTDRFAILSLSPEKFIKKTGEHVVTKPMKGTWPRKKNMFSDIAARIRFQYDDKNRAENIMIADLLRNDLGRVGKNIKAPVLFEVAKYRTLYQMTSTVTGKVARDIPIYDLFGALFPSGSVTGAPKLRSMQIIRGLEGEERKIYTGAIGYITPKRDLFFNIPIRTLLLENGRGEMGIGGGIVWDSTPQGEWDEGLLKASFLTKTCQNLKYQ